MTTTGDSTSLKEHDMEYRKMTDEEILKQFHEATQLLQEAMTWIMAYKDRPFIPETPNKEVNFLLRQNSRDGSFPMLEAHNAYLRALGTLVDRMPPKMEIHVTEAKDGPEDADTGPQCPECLRFGSHAESCPNFSIRYGVEPDLSDGHTDICSECRGEYGKHTLVCSTGRKEWEQVADPVDVHSHLIDEQCTPDCPRYRFVNERWEQADMECPQCGSPWKVLHRKECFFDVDVDPKTVSSVRRALAEDREEETRRRRDYWVSGPGSRRSGPIIALSEQSMQTFYTTGLKMLDVEIFVKTPDEPGTYNMVNAARHVADKLVSYCGRRAFDEVKNI